ncbi:MAG: hypothetical protein LBP59_10530 [Planctomycetaceae bacterium]|jgi:hypothetical protein|nr:hypothetical protein [Planctomycetaceae bacterium]
MKNQNIADISVFESIQTDQHTKTGMSQMNVFNNNCSIKNSALLDKAAMDVKKYRAKVDAFIKLGNEVAKRREKFVSKERDAIFKYETSDEYIKERIRVFGVLGANPNDPEALADEKQSNEIATARYEAEQKLAALVKSDHALFWRYSY